MGRIGGRPGWTTPGCGPAEEAQKLSDALVAGGGRQCRGSLMIDLKLGEGILGTGHEYLADGLSAQQRTAKLVQFLREGAFKWGVYHRFEAGRDRQFGAKQL